MTLGLWQRIVASRLRAFRDKEKTRGIHPSRAPRVPSRIRRAPKSYDIRAHSFLPTPYTEAAKAGWPTDRERQLRGRGKYSCTKTLAKITASAVLGSSEERVIPFNWGIEFFPNAESSWHRVRTTPPPSLHSPPPPPRRSAVTPRFPPSARKPHTQVPAVLPASTRPPALPRRAAPSPRISQTALLQSQRRVAHSNYASRWRRADTTAAIELTRAAPLYAVVEGNKKCKSKRVGVGEWEKKIRGG